MTYNINDIFTEDEHYSDRAIWCNENGYFIQEIEQENGVRRFQICAPKEKSLSELKLDKLAELSTKASSFEQTENKEMYIISSLGYKVNADPKALRNIEVLIELGVTQFRNYDNENVEVTTDNLKTIKSEIGINSVKLYQQKWAMQDLINKAETIEELNSIEIKFTMTDFTSE